MSETYEFKNPLLKKAVNSYCIVYNEYYGFYYLFAGLGERGCSTIIAGRSMNKDGPFVDCLDNAMQQPSTEVNYVVALPPYHMDESKAYTGFCDPVVSKDCKEITLTAYSYGSKEPEVLTTKLDFLDGWPVIVPFEVNYLSLENEYEYQKSDADLAGDYEFLRFVKEIPMPPVETVKLSLLHIDIEKGFGLAGLLGSIKGKWDYIVGDSYLTLEFSNFKAKLKVSKLGGHIVMSGLDDKGNVIFAKKYIPGNGD